VVPDLVEQLSGQGAHGVGAKAATSVSVVQGDVDYVPVALSRALPIVLTGLGVALVIAAVLLGWPDRKRLAGYARPRAWVLLVLLAS
jgi:hypothetical protein